LEKSSKTYISLFQEAKPSQAATRTIPPTSSQVATADFPRGGPNLPFAGAVFTRRIHSRDERGEGGVICETMQIQHEDGQ
jgi:hypothetical protein